MTGSGNDRPGKTPAASGQELAKEPSFAVVGIGASAGGLEALSEFFSHLNVKSEMAFVVVQHLDPSHESLLASILSKQTKHPVVEAKDGTALKPDCIFTIPSNQLIWASKGRLRLEKRTEAPGLFMPIDHLFRSLAAEYGRRAIAVILSGGGSDGALGLQEIKANGGITFAQDERTAKFYSMPHSAILTGAVDFSLSPKEIAQALAKLKHHDYLKPLPPGIHAPPIDRGSDDFRALLRLVHQKTGIDFSSYKFPTVSRRILRRMALQNIDSLARYQRFLSEHPTEIKTLSHDILIQVTKFFRDPKTFQFLSERVFPRLVEGKAPEESLRIWVPGCATGEEAYSVLMQLMEFFDEHKSKASVQMFATDLNDAAIARAREGRYVENILLDLSPERARRFFTKVGNQYEINKALRELCIFAVHNILSDPPFAKIDLITCRNVLIYLEPPLQKRVLSIFHYALKPHGVLVLGNAETVGPASEMYELLDGDNHAYTKKPITNRLYFDFVGTQITTEKMTPQLTASPIAEDAARGLSIQREIDRVLVSEYVPPAVVINSALEVVQFRGKTGPYFEHASGFASFELLKMLREGLVAEVRNAIDEVRDKGNRVRKENIRISFNEDVHHIAIEVIPVTAPLTEERFLILLFEDMDAPSYEVMKQRHDKKRAAQLVSDDLEGLSALRSELSSTKDYLQSVNEEKEAANEELRAANEEIMSSNEELQSTNEELHTAKEELQSTNEELLTVNDELKNRNQELFQLNNDLTNLFASLNVAVLILSSELRIRKFTPMAEKILRLIPADIGRSINDLRWSLEVKNLEKIALEVIETVTPREMEVQNEDGGWWSLQIRPYRTSDNRIDGVVLLFADINRIKMGLEYAEAVEETMGQPLLVLDGDLKVKRANPTFYEVFKTTAKDTVGRYIYRLGNGQWDLPELKKLLEEVLPQKKAFRKFKVEHNFPEIGVKTMFLAGKRLFHHQKDTETILLCIEPIE